MKRPGYRLVACALFWLLSGVVALGEIAVNFPKHALHFTNVVTRWDEALPLGNGILGALVWGDGKGYSKFTYRPFTLEGNLAEAAGIQEMLLQSHRGRIEVFPAIPSSWQDVSFTTLRAEGAFLVSAERHQGSVERVEILAERGGECRLLSPWSKSEKKRELKAGERWILVSGE